MSITLNMSSSGEQSSNDASDFENNFIAQSQGSDIETHVVIATQKPLEQSETGITKIVEGSTGPPVDSADAPAIIVPHPIVPATCTYAITRESHVTIRGKSYYYKFFKQGAPLFFAKSKSRYPTIPVPIKTEGDVHLGHGPYNYVLAVDQGTGFFTLHEKEVLGPSIMELHFYKNNSAMQIPGKMDLTLLREVDGIPKELSSKMPRIGKQGVYVLDFHNRFTIPSIKNAIFVAKGVPKANDVMCVRKITADSLEIDCFLDVPDFIVFGLSLSIFVAKMK